jgi:D-xylose transport system permease protein
MAVLVTNAGIWGPLACLLAIALGIFMGTAQGMLIAYIGIPSFVVTLAGNLGFQGLMLKILGIHGAINMRDPFVRGITTVAFPPIVGWILAVAFVAAFSWIALRRQARRRAIGLELDSPATVYGSIAFFAVLSFAAVWTLNSYRGVPLLVVLLIGMTALLGWVTTSTPFGRMLFAVGGNQESARRVGISVQRTRVAAFGIVGMMAAIGGIVGASRYASVSFNAFAGGPLLLEAIGAAVIGGTSLFGGRGSVWNAILGALVIGSLGNGLDLSGASAADKLMFSGAILLLAVAIDALSRGGGNGGR